MKTIAQRVWNEPAACIGLFTTLLLLAWNIIDQSDWSVEAIIAIMAPFASSLGIRQLVRPDTGQGVTTTGEPPKVPK